MATRWRFLAAIGAAMLLGAGAATRPADDHFVRTAADGSIHVGDATITLTLPSKGLPVSEESVRHWVAAAGNAVGRYYGRYPVRHVRIAILSDNGDAVHGGTEFDGRFIRIHLGGNTTEADLRDDWMLTHEMFHLGFPEQREEFHWSEEGLSDYLEPLARARVGNLSPEEVWGGFVEGMPKGLPHPGDQGLDGTHSWGRIYWGGCLFWLLADVRIREQTHNQRSLDDAIRTIVNEGGDGGTPWPFDRVIAVGDRATGTTVLKDLHDEMGAKPVTPDLPALWRRLGVVAHGERITFDDTAPLAAIRKSMTDPSANPPLPDDRH